MAKQPGEVIGGLESLREHILLRFPGRSLRVDFYSSGGRRGSSSFVVYAVDWGVVVRVYRNGLFCNWAYIRPLRTLSKRQCGSTELVWHDWGYKHANRDDALAQVHDRATTELADICAALW